MGGGGVAVGSVSTVITSGVLMLRPQQSLLRLRVQFRSDAGVLRTPQSNRRRALACLSVNVSLFVC